MTEDSSDDGEPMISSPGSSSAEDDGEDCFNFHAQRFKREAVVHGVLSPSPRKGKRGKKKSASSDRQLKMQQRQKRLRIDERMKRNAKRCFGEDSSDDDFTDDERNRNSVISIDEDSPSRAKSKGSENNVTVELLESSDEEDNTNVSFAAVTSAMSHEAAQAIQKSKSAIAELQQAQQYHAEDITVATPTEPKPKSVELAKQVTTPASPPGKTLQITCRAVVHLNGKKQKDRVTIVKIRENEKLQLLLEKFMDQNDLPEYSVVVMKFDGQTLNYGRTPKSYQMENHDLVDVQAKSNIVSMQSVPNKVGQKISLTMRERVGKHVKERKFKLGKLQNMQDLFQMYEEEAKTKKKCTYHFDGQSLHPSKTPSYYEMEEDDLIDVVYR